MGGKVYVLAQTYDDFENHALTALIELIREEFSAYKSGGEFDHEWFCHEVGPDPGKFLRHVHFIPTNPADEAEWLTDFQDKHKYRRRTSDRYVLYAHDARHGYLIIDILDDPGAHDLWMARHTKLPKYELAATDFCTYGTNSNFHK